MTHKKSMSDKKAMTHKKPTTKYGSTSGCCLNGSQEMPIRKNSNISGSRDKDILTKEHVAPDAGFSWVVCSTSFMANAILFGITNNFGIIFVEMKKYYSMGEDSSGMSFKTSWVGTLQITMTFLMSPLSSRMVKKLGLRTTSLIGVVAASSGMLASSYAGNLAMLYVTYGFITGTGCSLIYTPSLLILGHYFQRHLGIANGIASTGSSIATVILPLILRYLLQNHGLAVTLRFLAILLLSLSFCVVTWIPLIDVNSPSSNEPEAEEEDGDAEDGVGADDCLEGGGASSVTCCPKNKLLRNRGYVMWSIAVPIACLGYFVPFIHLVAHAKRILPPTDKPEVLMMILGSLSGISRLVCGKISDLSCISRVRMQQISFFTIGLAIGSIPLASSFTWLAVIVVVVGIADGCFVSMVAPIAFELLGVKSATTGLGVLYCLLAGPMTAGPPLAGLINDLTDSYNLAFYLAGIPPIISALIMFAVPSRGMLNIPSDQQDSLPVGELKEGDETKSSI